MSKVLVDREDLEAVHNFLAHGGQAVAVLRWAENILAQPAEAQGVEAPVVACISSETGELYREDYGLKDPIYLVLQSDHLAALSAVTAERDRLREALEFAVREQSGDVPTKEPSAWLVNARNILQKVKP